MTTGPESTQSVTPAAYIQTLAEPRRGQIQELYDLITATAPQLEPFMLKGMGAVIIGFGPYHYKYASGREGDWFVVGLASNKASISVYVSPTDASGYVAERYQDRLPKASIGKSCIRFKRPTDIDLDVLAVCIREGVGVHTGTQSSS